MSREKDLSLIERAVSRMGQKPSSQPAASAAQPGPAAEEAAPSAERHIVDGLEELERLESFEPLELDDDPAPQIDAPAVAQAPERKTRRRTELDFARLKAEGFVVPSDGRSQLAEEFRMIKRPLLENAFGKSASLVDQGNLIMVTSAYAGEGKTFTAVNLALSMTREMEKTVLLIDADVGRSRIDRILNVPATPGLLDLLLDEELDVADVIVATSIPNLRVLPRGRTHPLATELLASNEMARLTQELATRYPDRVVIFDSPPLLITSEAVVLASHMGQIVFVVESNRTPQSAVKGALALLDSGKPIGLVLNKSRRTLGTDYYGYGAYYHAEEVPT